MNTTSVTGPADVVLPGSGESQGAAPSQPGLAFTGAVVVATLTTGLLLLALGLMLVFASRRLARRSQGSQGSQG